MLFQQKDSCGSDFIENFANPGFEKNETISGFSWGAFPGVLISFYEKFLIKLFIRNFD